MSVVSKKQSVDRHSFFSRLQEGFGFMRECSLCKQPYNLDGAAVLFDQDPVHLVHVQCAHCHNAMLTIVTVSDTGMSSFGLYTDLLAGETLYFHSKDPVREDDIFALHRELQSKENTFVHLFH